METNENDDLDTARGVTVGLGSVLCIAIIVAVLIWSVATLWPYAAGAMR